MLGLGVENAELVLPTFLVVTVVAVTIGMLVVHWTMRSRRSSETVGRMWLVSGSGGVLSRSPTACPRSSVLRSRCCRCHGPSRRRERTPADNDHIELEKGTLRCRTT